MDFDPVPPEERRDLQLTARELGRWQGTVDTRLQHHEDHLRRINGSLERIADSLRKIESYIASEEGADDVARIRNARMTSFQLAALAGGSSLLIGLLVFVLNLLAGGSG